MSKPTKRLSLGFLLLFLLGVAGSAALSYYVVTTTPMETAELHPVVAKPSAPATNVEPPTKRVGEQVIVYKPSSSGLDVHFQPVSQDLPSGADAKAFAISTYLKQIPAVPKDSAVLSVVVSDGTATVNFNRAIAAGYGSMDEKIILDGICATLGQFPDVQRVSVQVEGKPIDSLGHADLTEPMEVIRVAPVP